MTLNSLILYHISQNKSDINIRPNLLHFRVIGCQKLIISVLIITQLTDFDKICHV